nr:MAG TPA: hypothetical protein [Caudoviricetes sp.]
MAHRLFFTVLHGKSYCLFHLRQYILPSFYSLCSLIRNRHKKKRKTDFLKIDFKARVCASGFKDGRGLLFAAKTRTDPFNRWLNLMLSFIGKSDLTFRAKSAIRNQKRMTAL